MNIRALKKALIAPAFALALAMASSCAPAPAPAPIAPEGWYQVFLTRDGSDATTLSTGNDGSIDAAAPLSNLGINSRSLFGRLDAPVSVDQMSCSTVAHSGGVIQDGVALRVRIDGNRTRAITVTRNIWLGATSTYNVHLWDTNQTVGLPGVHIASEFISGLSNGNTTSPRRLCAEVGGSTLTFKVWLSDQPEPSWDDTTASRTVQIPAGWEFEGQPGLYIGHLPPGATANLSSTTIRPDSPIQKSLPDQLLSAAG